MKILNLYAGIGGNRKLWGEEHEVTAVEYEPYIAEAYKKMYPNDEVIVADAHQFLIDHYMEYDFIWASPPCPTHSKMSTVNVARGRRKYPDMALYQEILWLKHFFKGKWVVENVTSYYDPLIQPTVVLDRHYIWSNFPIKPIGIERNYGDGAVYGHNVGGVTNQPKEVLAEAYGITLPEGTKNQRKLLRNAVIPSMGEYILEQSMGIDREQTALLPLFEERS